MNQVRVAVIGASGYSGQDLIRLLVRHPAVNLVCVTSRQSIGKPISEVYPRFKGHPFSDLKFSNADVSLIKVTGAEVAFLAVPHGTAQEYAGPLLDAGLRVIDLSADFRIKDAKVYEEFYQQPAPPTSLLEKSVYGLPEFYRDLIKNAALVASPGCYPTSILLPLLPLLRKGLLQTEAPANITIASMSGVSGAGRKADIDLLYCECNESARAYRVPKHQHLAEVEQELSFAAGKPVIVSFTPHLIPVNRGIITTTYAYLAAGVRPEAIGQAFGEAYKEEPFVRLLGETGSADIKNVAHTNFIDITWRYDSRTGRVVLMSAEDNLVKGASGQAIQSFNLMFGWPEATGL
jgi:N-acetyl-gamma-glutamyl-phosphate reductase